MTGEELRMRRLALGFIQAKLARALGVREATIGRWERGDLSIQHPRMVSLALAALEEGYGIDAAGFEEA